LHDMQQTARRPTSGIIIHAEQTVGPIQIKTEGVPETGGHLFQLTAVRATPEHLASTSRSGAKTAAIGATQGVFGPEVFSNAKVKPAILTEADAAQTIVWINFGRLEFDHRRSPLGHTVVVCIMQDHHAIAMHEIQFILW